MYPGGRRETTPSHRRCRRRKWDRWRGRKVLGVGVETLEAHEPFVYFLSFREPWKAHHHRAFDRFEAESAPSHPPHASEEDDDGWDSFASRRRKDRCPN